MNGTENDVRIRCMQNEAQHNTTQHNTTKLWTNKKIKLSHVFKYVIKHSMLRHNQICSTNHETQTGAVFLFITPSFADGIHIFPFCSRKHKHNCIVRPRWKEKKRGAELQRASMCCSRFEHTRRLQCVLKRL